MDPARHLARRSGAEAEGPRHRVRLRPREQSTLRETRTSDIGRVWSAGRALRAAPRTPGVHGCR